MKVQQRDRFIRIHYKETIVPVAYVLGSKDDKCFVTTKDLRFNLSNGKTFWIPKGYRFDGASVPRFLWSLIPRIDDRLLAVLLHDYMYFSDYLRDKLTDKEAKSFADKEMLIWLNIQLPNQKFKNKSMYYAVKYLGWKIFNRRNTQTVD